MENSLGQEAFKFQKQCNKETLTLTLFNRPKEYGELSSQRVNLWVQKVEAATLYEAKMQNHKSEVLLASDAKEPLQV